MAEIDNTSPLTPVWPQRPIRRIEDDDPAKDERRRPKQEKQQDQDGNKDNNDDDGKPHIDEYA